MLAMVLAAAVPALAQSVTQVGNGNQACVQTAVQTEVDKVQVNQYGDNINIQAISQQCNVSVAQVNSVVASVSSASASAAPAAQYEYKAPAAAQYQYSSSPSASASASASPAAELPETGGSSLIALGAGVLLVAGGLLARRIVR
jgi:LPXTG-motif cell wall-anchored protein